MAPKVKVDDEVAVVAVVVAEAGVGLLVLPAPKVNAAPPNGLGFTPVAVVVEVDPATEVLSVMAFDPKAIPKGMETLVEPVLEVIVGGLTC